VARYKRHNWVTTLGAHGPGKIKPEPKFKHPVTIDPEQEYLKAVAQLEKEIPTLKGHHSLPEKQLQLAQLHKEQVVSMGFKPQMAELGFFVAGPDNLEHSLAARRLWEAAEKLEKQAKKLPQKRV
jgi:hypothetical protein